MKRHFRRVLALMTVLCLLAVSAQAADETHPFRELRPPTPFEIGPQWSELDVSIQSGDNTLRGTLTAPKKISGNLPVAILLHGLNTDRHWCDDIAWCLADHGIASVRFDFAGNGQSDGAQEDMTVTSEVQDVLAMVEYVKSLRFTDPDNIFLIGKSMGGVAATLASQDCYDDITAMCLWYPGFSASFSTKFGYFLGEFFTPWDPPETMTIAGYTYGREFLVELQQMDCQGAMESFDKPVLILHGDRDYIAPLQGSLWANDTFPDCTLQVVPGGWHGFSMDQEMQALEDMTQFITEHLA